MPKKPNTHLARVQRAVARINCAEAYLVADPKDIFYFTGIYEPAAMMFLSKKAVFFALPEMLKAQFNAVFRESVIIDSRKLKKNISALKEHGIKSILVDPKKISCHLADNLKKIGGFKWIFGRKFDIAGGLRVVKDSFEIQNIKKACGIAKKTYLWVKKAIRPGLSELEIAGMIKRKMVLLGADGLGFEPIVAVDENSSMPHHRAGNKLVSKNSVVLMDFGCSCGGYNSDLTRTVYLSKMHKLYIKINKIVLKAYEEAVSFVKPGVSFAAVDARARKVIKKAGYEKEFMHGIGHGIGLDVHERPACRLVKGAVLRAGMVITIEPGIYIKNTLGVRFENTLLVTKTGCEIL